MHSLLNTDVLLDAHNLSRSAAERYAVLAAVNERRTLTRRRFRPTRPLAPSRSGLATQVWSWTRRVSAVAERGRPAA